MRLLSWVHFIGYRSSLLSQRGDFFWGGFRVICFVLYWGDADDLNGAVAGCLKTRSTLSAGRRFIEDAEMGACPRQIFGYMHETLNIVLKNN